MSITAIRRRVRRHSIFSTALVALALAIVGNPTPALALSGSTPIVVLDGAVSCPTCTSAASALTDKGLIVGSGGSRGVAVVTPNTSSTRQFAVQASGSNGGVPFMDVIAQGDLPSESAAQLVTRITGETGSDSGTPLPVFNQNPTINGVTATGTWDLSGATVQLPSDAVDAIGQVASGIKSGNGSKLATASGSLTAGNFASIDANGNFVDSGVSASSGGAKPIVAFNSETKLTAGSNTVYLGIGGRVSATEADVLTPISAATLGELRCYASASTGGTGITVTLGVGACTGALTYTGSKPEVTVSSTTAVADTTNTGAVTAGQCVALRAAKVGPTTTDVFLNCSLAKIANS